MKTLIATVAVLFTTFTHAEQPNTRTVTETFQDWQLVCIEKGADKQCRVTQTMANQAGQPVAILNLVKKENGKPVLEMGLPLMIDLTKPLEVQINEQKAFKYPYQFCNNAACFVLVDGDEALLAAFKKGTVGTLAISPMGNESVNFNFSLNGFSAAFAALKADE